MRFLKIYFLVLDSKSGVDMAKMVKTQSTPGILPGGSIFVIRRSSGIQSLRLVKNKIQLSDTGKNVSLNNIKPC